MATSDPIALLRSGSPRARLVALLSDSALYGAVTALTRGLSIVTVPILTRTLTLQQFGTLDALQVVLATTVAAATLGQDSALARLFYDTDDVAERRRITGTALGLQLAAAALGALIIAIAAAAGWLPAAEISSGGAILFLLVAIVPITIGFQFYRNLLKWVFARQSFILVTVGGAGLVVALTAVLVGFVRLEIVGAFTAIATGLGIAALLGAWVSRHLIARGSWTTYGRPLLAIGLPYMAVAVAGALIPAIDRWVILHQLSLGSLGIYALGARIASLLQLPIMAFQTAWGPFALSIYREPDAATTYGRVLSVYTGFVALAGFALVALTEPMLVLIGSPEYLPARLAVIPLTFGVLIESLGWITGLGIDLSKRTYLATASYALGVVTTAVAAWTLAPIGGLVGVAAGVLTGRMVQTVMYTVLGQRAFPLKMPWASAAIVLITSLALSVLIQWLVLPSLAANVVLRAGIGIVLATLVWRMSLAPDERVAILRRLRLA